MKKTLLILFSFFTASYCEATMYTIVNAGNTFSPASLTVAAGDTVIFNIASVHDALEVDQTTWNNNQSTPLPGGFSVPFGGGMLLTAGLSQGMHWYVCQNHIGSGMKGIIEVNGTVGTVALNPESAGILVAPNPFSSQTTIHAPGIDRIAVYNVLGRLVDEVGIHSQNGSTLTFNGEALARGLYFFRFLHEGRVVETRAVVLH